MRHVHAIGQFAHPIGSPEARAVRQYIEQELRRHGWEVSSEPGTALYRESAAIYQGGSVWNVVARLKGGTPSGGAIALACHYDSVVQGPGASDDGHAVAMLLEIARALARRPGLSHDVILLFTDGEEPALLGSEQFLSQHPWARDIRFVANFEARGASGPGLLFEAWPPAAGVQVGAAVPRPVGSSALVEIYRRMQLDTDFTFFQKAGIPGVNSAFIESGQFYHTSQDSPGRLDPRSLQHQTGYAMAAIEHPPAVSRRATESLGDRVFFNAGPFFIHYPVWLSWILQAMLCVFVVWRLSVDSGFENAFCLLRSGAVILLMFVAAGVIGWAASAGFEAAFPDRASLGFGQLYAGSWWLAGFVLMMVIPLTWMASKVTSLSAGPDIVARTALAVILLAGATAATVAIPAGAYLIQALCAGCFILAWAAGSPILAVLAAVIVLPVWIPIVRFLDAGLGIASWPLLSILTVCLLISLRIGSWLPMGSLVGFVPWGVGIVALACCAIAWTQGRFQSDQPRPANLLLAWNADEDVQLWLARQEYLDKTSAAFRLLGASPRREVVRWASSWLEGGETFWTNPASPKRKIEPPVAEVLSKSEDPASPGDRIFRVRVRSPRGARGLIVRFQCANGVSIRQMEDRTPSQFGLQDVPQRTSQFLSIRGLPAEGIVITVQAGSGPFRVALTEYSNNLAELEPGAGIAASTFQMTSPEEDYFSQAVLVYKSFQW